MALKAGSGGLSKLVADMRAQLTKLTQSDFTGHHLLQLKKQALVLDFIHYCDVAEALAKDKTAGVGEWGWTRQLRYYHRAEGSVKVCMAEATFDYTWEYQGNAPKLVYTPLTDKCYLTLTQARGGGGGAWAGPVARGTCAAGLAGAAGGVSGREERTRERPSGPAAAAGVPAGYGAGLRRQPLRPRGHGQDRVGQGTGPGAGPPGAGVQLR